MYKNKNGVLFLLLGMLMLTGCGTLHHHRYSQLQDGGPTSYIDVSKVPDAVPKVEPYSRYGNPSSYVVMGHRYYVMKTSSGYDEKGIASWYGTKFHKHRTSSGEPYNLAAMSAAHKTLPIPCYARVTNLKNGKKVIVKINDRGPFHENRIIDLSYAAARKLGILGTGLVEVTTIDARHPDRIPEASRPRNPQLYLQIGAFSSRANAEKALNQIHKYTATPITINEGERQGHPIYRVRIGPLVNVDTSDILHHELRRCGLGEPRTVIE